MKVRKIRTKPRYFVPEVVQTSAMDCGPASLKSLLEGFGVPVSYGRLREACQTDVDGTSIDTMEEVAVQLGLDAEQVMVPVDHFLLSEAKTLPAIAVVRLPNGVTHFVVVWKRRGGLVQIMDPGTGRRWMSARRLLDELYEHQMPVPAEDWNEWARTKDFIKPLSRRLTDLGVSRGLRKRLINEALSDPTWRGLAGLDAATRMVAAVSRSGGLRVGRQTARVIRAFFEQARKPDSDDGQRIPAGFWSVRPFEQAPDGTELLILKGAVLVRVKGPRDRRVDVEAGGDGQEPLSPELVAALEEPRTRPARHLLRFLRADGVLTPSFLVVALAIAAVGVLVEALLFRGIFEVGGDLALGSQRLTAVIVLLTLVGGLLLLSLPIQGSVLRLGRNLEIRLRLAFLRKIPRLGDRYFQSRLTSDMAERSHSVHVLRGLPGLGTRLLTAIFELALTTAGIIWLAPTTAPLVLLAAFVGVALPIVVQPPLRERDLRVRTHVGALSRFYLDGLLGLIPVRTHGAERSMRRGHEGLLVDWMRAGLSLQKTVVLTEMAQALAGFGLVALLLMSYLGQGGQISAVLLLVYWSLNLPVLGQEIALVARMYPGLRNVTLRLLEPLGAPEAPAPLSEHEVEPKPSGNTVGVEIGFEGLGVRVAGHTILDGINVKIANGEHIAIVGPSGAGKSSLVGVLLGWHRPAAGRVTVDGQTLDEERIQRLRRETAWVDPAVQLWNRSLFYNMQYGNSGTETRPLAGVIRQADLRSLLESLPDGLQTNLGEGGALVSGGEGQRVRLGRAMVRRNVRLVILDEPFRGLDRPKRAQLLARARLWWGDATLICITHDISQTDAFGRVLVIEGGRLVEDGSPSDLKSQAGSRYRSLAETETAVRTGLWTGVEWKHLWLEDGQVVAKAQQESTTGDTRG